MKSVLRIFITSRVHSKNTQQLMNWYLVKREGRSKFWEKMQKNIIYVVKT